MFDKNDLRIELPTMVDFPDWTRRDINQPLWRDFDGFIDFLRWRSAQEISDALWICVSKRVEHFYQTTCPRLEALCGPEILWLNTLTSKRKTVEMHAMLREWRWEQMSIKDLLYQTFLTSALQTLQENEKSNNNPQTLFRYQNLSPLAHEQFMDNLAFNDATLKPPVNLFVSPRPEPCLFVKQKWSENAPTVFMEIENIKAVDVTEFASYNKLGALDGRKEKGIYMIPQWTAIALHDLEEGPNVVKMKFVGKKWY
jgi:hypothetical protein